MRRKGSLLVSVLPAFACSRGPRFAWHAAAACAAALVLAPSRASAYEHQWHVGGSFGYAVLLDGSTWNGFGGGAHVAYGINDTFNLMAQIDVTDHPAGHWLLVSGGVGAAYVVDVLQWVPYIGALVGPVGLISTDKNCGLSTVEVCHVLRFNLEVPFGIDYQVSRSFSVGLASRFQLVMPGPTPTPWPVLTAAVRAEYTWGY